MALGVGVPHRLQGGVFAFAGALLEAAVATGNGEWVEVWGISPISVHVKGITTATVQISISNEPTKPANSDHGIAEGAGITADTMVVVTKPARWMKVRVTAWTSGTISAYFCGGYY